VDAQKFILRIAKQIHHLVHAIKLKKAMAVIQVPLHAKVDKAVDKIQGFLVCLFQIIHIHLPAS
jgi:hypothetical protein